MVLPLSVPARPALEGDCSCVWPSEYSRQAQVVEKYSESEDRVEAIKNPLATIAAIPSAVSNTVSHYMPGSLGGNTLPEDTPAMFVDSNDYMMASSSEDTYPPGSTAAARFNNTGNPAAAPGVTARGQETKHLDSGGNPKADYYASHGTTSTKQNLSARMDPGKERDEATKRLQKKSSNIKTNMSEQKARSTPARKVKLIFRMTPEMKLRDLLSAREDLVVLLRTLIPTYLSSETQSVVPKSDTRLCGYCATQLASSLYHCPARLNAYIGEGSTRAFLTLVDDAVASLSNDVRMETISHREVESILRAELAITEWRMAVKMARLHKKTGIADLFPMKVGAFAELYHSAREPQIKPDSILKKGAKAALGVIGMGSAQNTTHGQMAQGAAKTAASQ